MKKLCAVLTAVLMLFVLTSQADAAQLGRVNLKDKATIKAMKNGTMSFKGVKLGQPIQTAKKKWGKDYDGIESTYQHYDYTMSYGSGDEYEEEDFDMFEGYFQGKRGMKVSQYRLLYINYYGSGSILKYKDMMKYWGKSDFHYVTGDEEVFFYGQTGLIYDNHDGQYLGYKYVTKNSVKEIKKKFLK